MRQMNSMKSETIHKNLKLSFFSALHITVKTVYLKFEVFSEISPFGFQCWSEEAVFYSEHLWMKVQLFYL